jgi:hypothetical protein
MLGDKMRQCKSDFGTYECDEKLILNGKSVWVDGCLAEEIKELNNKGVRTVASCCGHKKIIPVITVDNDDLESRRIMEQLGYQWIETKGLNGISFEAKSCLGNYTED